MRRRFALAIAGVAAVAVILFGIPLAVVLARSYREDALLRLQRDTVAATRSIDTSAGLADRPELPAFQGALAVYAPAGRRLTGAGPALADGTVRLAVRLRAPVARAPNGTLVVAIPLFEGEQLIEVMRARRSQAAVAEATREAWLKLGGLAAAVIAAAALAAALLGRRLTRPLAALAAVARRVGEGDFAARAARGPLPEIDEVASALNASSQRIAGLVAREREFTANASHQLNTPLAALRLELEALELSDGPRPELVAALAQADRLQTTLATLLLHARDRSADPGQATDLPAALAAVQARWHGLLAASGRPLRVNIATSNALAAMPMSVLDEILDVLLRNAFEHGAGTVTLTARDSGQAIAIEVLDHGPGFAGDPELAFARGAGAGQGRGIGLALARSLAHASAARLEITRARAPTAVTLFMSRARERGIGAPPAPAPGPGPPGRSGPGRSATLS